MGVEAVSAWEGSRVPEEEGQIGAELVLGSGQPMFVILSSLEQPAARETSEKELQYWIKNNPFTTGPVDTLDPVVVDGEEMLRARGDGPFGPIDWFVRATGEVTVRVVFSTPDDLSETKREEYIGQVMATLEFE